MLHGHIKKDHFTSFFYCFGLYGSSLLVGAAAERTACSRAPRVTIELAAEDSAFFFFFYKTLWQVSCRRPTASRSKITHQE